MSHVTCKISDAEWQVMKVIWHKAPLTASSIIEYLKPETDWSPKTVQTLISRLVKKGALGVKKDIGLNQYYPLVSQEECAHGETKSLLQKVYGGSLSLLLTNFVQNEDLSAKEIEDLRKLLDAKIK